MRVSHSYVLFIRNIIVCFVITNFSIKLHAMEKHMKYYEMGDDGKEAIYSHNSSLDVILTHPIQATKSTDKLNTFEDREEEERIFRKEKEEKKQQKLKEVSIIVGRSVNIDIPKITHNHKDIYQRFVSGKLIYKPDPNSDAGKIELPIASLLNPLEGTFDLSSFGSVAQYLSISTGYRKGIIATNANKVEVWIVPKFLVELNLTTTAAHYRNIMESWSSPIALFWTWGGLKNLEWYDYLTALQFDEIFAEDLYENSSSLMVKEHIPSFSADGWNEIFKRMRPSKHLTTPDRQRSDSMLKSIMVKF